MSLLDIPEIDLVVVASAAVCASTGARLGKGAGYREVEWAILAELGRVSDVVLDLLALQVQKYKY